MRDLVRESGLPRETIHFYVAKGLLPPGIKTGRNTAYYTEEHLDRLRRIQEIREREFLPLKAIQAILDERPGKGRNEFTPEQTGMLRRLRGRVSGWLRDGAQTPISEVAGGKGRESDVRELAELGIIQLSGQGKRAKVSSDDAAILEGWVRLKEIGIGPERGFAPSQFGIHARAIAQMVREEMALFSERYAGVPAGEAARTVELAIPILNEILSALHRKRVREVLRRT